jgi:uncharacterized protein YdaU (DUF1376 family)
MHYYQFNIGDYATHTRHLSIYEDLAYRRLLDWYYLNEKPIPADAQQAAKLILMRNRYPDVECVLQEFFQLTENGWINKRADAEISKFKEFSEAGKRGAAKRWSKGGDSPPIAPLIANNNHKPLTTNQDNSKPLAVGNPNCPHEEIISLYHEHLSELPSVKVWNEKRKSALQSRWREDKKRQSLDYWKRFFVYVSQSDFLCGRSGTFKASLEWLVNSGNFVKVIEGNYVNRSKE